MADPNNQQTATAWSNDEIPNPADREAWLNSIYVRDHNGRKPMLLHQFFNITEWTNFHTTYWTERHIDWILEYLLFTYPDALRGVFITDTRFARNCYNVEIQNPHPSLDGDRTGDAFRAQHKICIQRIKAVDIVIIPISQIFQQDTVHTPEKAGAHWSLIVVDRKKKTARYIDPLVQTISVGRKAKARNIRLNGVVAGLVLRGFDQLLQLEKGAFTATTLKWTANCKDHNAFNPPGKAFDRGASGPFILAFLSYLLQLPQFTDERLDVYDIFAQNQGSNGNPARSHRENLNFNSGETRKALESFVQIYRANQESANAPRLYKLNMTSDLFNSMWTLETAKQFAIHSDPNFRSIDGYNINNQTGPVDTPEHFIELFHQDRSSLAVWIELNSDPKIENIFNGQEWAAILQQRFWPGGFTDMTEEGIQHWVRRANWLFPRGNESQAEQRLDIARGTLIAVSRNHLPYKGDMQLVPTALNLQNSRSPPVPPTWASTNAADIDFANLTPAQVQEWMNNDPMPRIIRHPHYDAASKTSTKALLQMKYKGNFRGESEATMRAFWIQDSEFDDERSNLDAIETNDIALRLRTKYPIPWLFPGTSVIRRPEVEDFSDHGSEGGDNNRLRKGPNQGPKKTTVTNTSTNNGTNTGTNNGTNTGTSNNGETNNTTSPTDDPLEYIAVHPNDDPPDELDDTPLSPPPNFDLNTVNFTQLNLEECVDWAALISTPFQRHPRFWSTVEPAETQLRAYRGILQAMHRKTFDNESADNLRRWQSDNPQIFGTNNARTFSETEIKTRLNNYYPPLAKKRTWQDDGRAEDHPNKRRRLIVTKKAGYLTDHKHSIDSHVAETPLSQDRQDSMSNRAHNPGQMEGFIRGHLQYQHGHKFLRPEAVSQTDIRGLMALLGDAVWFRDATNFPFLRRQLQDLFAEDYRNNSFVAPTTNHLSAGFYHVGRRVRADGAGMPLLRWRDNSGREIENDRLKNCRGADGTIDWATHEGMLRGHAQAEWGGGFENVPDDEVIQFVQNYPALGLNIHWPKTDFGKAALKEILTDYFDIKHFRYSPQTEQRIPIKTKLPSVRLSSRYSYLTMGFPEVVERLGKDACNLPVWAGQKVLHSREEGYDIDLDWKIRAMGQLQWGGGFGRDELNNGLFIQLATNLQTMGYDIANPIGASDTERERLKGIVESWNLDDSGNP